MTTKRSGTLVLNVLQALVDSSGWPAGVHVRWLEERALRLHLSAVQDAVVLRSAVRDFSSLARVRLSELRAGAAGGGGSGTVPGGWGGWEAFWSREFKWLEKSETNGNDSDVMVLDADAHEGAPEAAGAVGAGAAGVTGAGEASAELGHASNGTSADKMEEALKVNGAAPMERGGRAESARRQSGVLVQRAFAAAAAAVEHASVAQADAAVWRVCVTLLDAARACFSSEGGCDGASRGGAPREDMRSKLYT